MRLDRSAICDMVGGAKSGTNVIKLSGSADRQRDTVLLSFSHLTSRFSLLISSR